MQNDCQIQEGLQLIASLQRDLNIVTAALLLTGQITIVGIFVTPPEFSLSLSGPLFGRTRLEGKNGNKIATSLIDVIDVIIAILLIVDAIRVVSSVVGPTRFAINVSGPIFGAPLYEPTLPILKTNYRFIKKIVSKHFNIDPMLFKNY
ncbi:hypothetical protein V7124_01365 [Neobacillus niacini]|jgi:hypothetical protein|uniref:hypothetical protein n=1 Tax=Neobacillus niacini TaxID=86668 RepID=UPI003000196D